MKKNSVTASTPVIQPKIQWKGHESFRHDLFKLQVSSCQKNVSFQKKLPHLIPVEHTHIYHSHSNRGEPQKHCVQVAGHTHEITTSIDANGHIVAKCGPAVKKVHRQLANGKSKIVYERVKYENAAHENDDGTHSFIEDNHTHQVVYLNSEEISQQMIKQIQQNNAEMIKQLNPDGPAIGQQTSQDDKSGALSGMMTERDVSAQE